jgi:hypothetical protein
MSVAYALAGISQFGLVKNLEPEVCDLGAQSGAAASDSLAVDDRIARVGGAVWSQRLHARAPKRSWADEDRIIGVTSFFSAAPGTPGCRLHEAKRTTDSRCDPFVSRAVRLMRAAT